MENDYKIIKKAYQIDFSKINEGYLSSGESCKADSLNEAKSILLKKIQYDGWTHRYTDNEITYLNIPVKRCKDLDLVEFEGESVIRCTIPEIKRKIERICELDNILNNKDIKYCYIMKRGTYYRPNSCGYTDNKFRAGIYSKEEAVLDAKTCDELTIVPIDINEHNNMLTKEIEDIKSRLIPEPPKE